jgi:hypothetical protein
MTVALVDRVCRSSAHVLRTVLDRVDHLVLLLGLEEREPLHSPVPL